MLRHLRIENFKAWKDTGEMELAPISVFLGTNSSGKSSIIQFLMMLKQTVQDPDPAVVLNTGDDKSIVDVGLPSHMLYRHDTSQPLRFSYEWDLDKTLFYLNKDEAGKIDIPENLQYVEQPSKAGAWLTFGNNVRFSCILRVGDDEQGRMETELHSYSFFHNDIFIASMELKKEENSFVMCSRVFNNNPEIWDETISPSKFYGFNILESILNDSNSKGGKHLNVKNEMNILHPNLFTNIYYLGPLRDRTSRLYTWKGTGPSDVGIDGSKAVFAMLNARLDFRKFQFPDSKTEYEIDTAVAVMLKKMGLIEQFQVHRIGPERMEYEVQVQTKGSPVWADLPDVGCGVSQVLPVLVELFYAPPGSILLMEQPELHLHPSAQAALADVMIDAVQAKENGKPRNIQLIIETHSEYFLRRLQRRVAEEAIDENTVRGYFCDSSTDPFQMKRLELDAYGNILNWPEDFFGDMAGDIFHQAEAAFGRKKDEYEKNAESH